MQNINGKNILSTGDIITISKCVGHTENDDGISSGGKWIEITGVYTAHDALKPELGGVLSDANTSKFIQCMNGNADYNGFPYRNVRVQL